MVVHGRACADDVCVVLGCTVSRELRLVVRITTAAVVPPLTPSAPAANRPSGPLTGRTRAGARALPRPAADGRAADRAHRGPGAAAGRPAAARHDDLRRAGRV